MKIEKDLIGSLLFIAPVMLITIGTGFFKRPIFFVLFLLTLAFCLSNKNYFNNVLKVIAKLTPMLILLIWCLISASWSLAPEKTVVDTFWQCLFIIYVVMISIIFVELKTITIIRIFLYLWVLYMFATVIVFDVAVGRYTEITGVFPVKNNFGTVLATMLSIFVFCRKRSIAYSLAISGALTLLIFTISKTAIMSFFMISTIIFLKNLSAKLDMTGLDAALRLSRNIFLKVMILVLPLTILNYYYEIYLWMLYEIPDHILTGRGLLWKEMLYQASTNLLYGVGYSSVWNIGELSLINATSLAYLHTEWVNKLVASDSGYIDIFISLGAIGIVLLVLLYIDYFTTYVKVEGKRISRYKNLSLYLFLYSLVNNITESTFLFSMNFVWLSFIFSYALIKYLYIKQSNIKSFGEYSE